MRSEIIVGPTTGNCLGACSKKEVLRESIIVRLTWQLAALVMAGTLTARSAVNTGPLDWPPISHECRPWSYWWWMGSAVDTTNLTRELQRYADAGWGGVHIIPIYGAKGWESNAIPYLSPRWVEMLRFTVSAAQKHNLGVDMTTGSGWCFGGPHVTDLEANALPVVKVYEIGVGERLKERFNRESIQALVAFGPGGKPIDLTDSISRNGEVFFSPPGNWTGPAGAAPPKTWKIYALSQKPSGQKVKRAGPGGAGHMLNLLSPGAMRHYLQGFEEALAGYDGPKPRAQYHDSYEYRSEWSPELFAEFEKRRGYRLQTELPALFGTAADEHAARVQCDYRETVSDIMAEETLPMWTEWAHRQGNLTRNQAHGSPGNLLDLYAVADVPETEMFHTDRDILVSKFASSAAHVTGKKLVASETGTWLEEHFTEKLSDMKYLQDDLFLAGVNHIIYHGTCYSPDEAPWPGWLFYASFEMNPRNSIWRDVPALNAYAARCQSVLQAGGPDNDLLLYWPIHDFWQRPGRLEQKFTVHAREWLNGQAMGRLARWLWTRGFAFDYVSDRQLAGTKCMAESLRTAGGNYRVLLVPSCRLIPVNTFAQVLALAEGGATVIFENQLPSDVPGAGDLNNRRSELRKLLSKLKLADAAGAKHRDATLGRGRVLVGEAESALAAAGVAREPMTDHAGLQFVRRRTDAGRHYFIANRGLNALDGWLPLATAAKSVVVLDPMTSRAGVAAHRQHLGGGVDVRLQLLPGESIILRTFAQQVVTSPAWDCWQPGGPAVPITGNWQVRFLQGGPQVPPPFQTAKLASWSELGGDEARRFAGTALYTITFDAPGPAARPWLLELGQVGQSARVRLNGRDLGTLLIPPFRLPVEELKPKENELEVEVTNVSANRIRDLDRRKVNWKNFHDINFVNLNYKPFDASDWPLTASGLLGPVSLSPLVKAVGERP
jgi:hypothetical protein